MTTPNDVQGLFLTLYLGITLGGACGTMCCWWLNLGRLYTKQEPYPLYSLCGPSNLYCGVDKAKRIGSPPECTHWIVSGTRERCHCVQTGRGSGIGRWRWRSEEIPKPGRDLKGLKDSMKQGDKASWWQAEFGHHRQSLLLESGMQVESSKPLSHSKDILGRWILREKVRERDFKLGGTSVSSVRLHQGYGEDLIWPNFL